VLEINWPNSFAYKPTIIGSGVTILQGLDKKLKIDFENRQTI